MLPFGGGHSKASFRGPPQRLLDLHNPSPAFCMHHAHLSGKTRAKPIPLFPSRGGEAQLTKKSHAPTRENSLQTHRTSISSNLQPSSSPPTHNHPQPSKLLHSIHQTSSILTQHPVHPETPSTLPPSPQTPTCHFCPKTPETPTTLQTPHHPDLATSPHSPSLHQSKETSASIQRVVH